ncbi:hypothetical protein HK098_001107 [Nowakowskiella sp. JEL0407]|nr:hypothetical protein HK098_001107 [Nowakowskiella sp. JEL0407]
MESKSEIVLARVTRLCNFLNSVRGTDKVLMLVQYLSKILIWRLSRDKANAALVSRISNLASPISDCRVLLRYYGLLPLVQWILVSELHPPPTLFLRFLYRVQNLCNLAYYPLEHVYWLALHKVIPITEKTRDRIGIWSCRFWAAYVILYFVQLFEERRLLLIRERALVKAKAGNEKVDISKIEQGFAEINEEKKSLILNTVINAAYFPLTIHWSLENSPFPEIGVGVCGTVAALLQIYTTWKTV